MLPSLLKSDMKCRGEWLFV